METRLKKLFQRKNGKITSVYFTAGFPKLNDTIKIIENLERSGVDLIEIGIPFSDPLADGPIIQQSGEKAIANGMTLKLLFEQIKDIRERTQIPLVLMGYLNTILQYGEQNFIEKCAEIGVDGIIIPDLPLEYYFSNFKKRMDEYNLSNIFLITSQTSDARLRLIDECSTSFIYMVSTSGITGSNKSLIDQKDYFERIQGAHLKHPTLIGFGIHDCNTFQTACEYSNGGIIGSAFIKNIAESGIELSSISNFINLLKEKPSK